MRKFNIVASIVALGLIAFAEDKPSPTPNELLEVQTKAVQYFNIKEQIAAMQQRMADALKKAQTAAKELETKYTCTFDFDTGTCNPIEKKDNK